MPRKCDSDSTLTPRLHGGRRVSFLVSRDVVSSTLAVPYVSQAPTVVTSQHLTVLPTRISPSEASEETFLVSWMSSLEGMIEMKEKKVHKVKPGLGDDQVYRPPGREAESSDGTDCTDLEVMCSDEEAVIRSHRFLRRSVPSLPPDEDPPLKPQDLKPVSRGVQRRNSCFFPDRDASGNTTEMDTVPPSWQNGFGPSILMSPRHDDQESEDSLHRFDYHAISRSLMNKTPLNPDTARNIAKRMREKGRETQIIDLNQMEALGKRFDADGTESTVQQSLVSYPSYPRVRARTDVSPPTTPSPSKGTALKEEGKKRKFLRRERLRRRERKQLQRQSRSGRWNY